MNSPTTQTDRLEEMRAAVEQALAEYNRYVEREDYDSGVANNLYFLYCDQREALENAQTEEDILSP